MNFDQPKHDPHGVQRLLDILRRQQDASSTSSSSAPSTSTITAPSAVAPSHPPNPFSPSQTAAEPSDTSISAVESQVEAAQRRRTYNTSSSKYGIPTAAEEPFDPYSFNPFSASNPVLSQPTPAPKPEPAPTPTPRPKSRDLASLSFADALPILSTLSTDKSLLRRLRSLRTQQHDLEKRLFKEYRQFTAIADKQYPNVKARKEQDEKRRTAMLKQWDECVSKQQEELNRAGVPGVKVTRDKRETEKQRKVLNVLVEMMDDEGE
ncbi:hypothetical protein EX895_001766 [Sporisorium graminicola]|uniref:Uncharacterized protein n=1 Tax=Sporisorium graminicola TaxID=280036 RepID=A0A4U7KWU4_9BASI|nr:hypothetical protein EX895_001766 [Sporisorium graminicola]TKY89235.1 hypothetical protein EX895_001766 [Sporisorium graminicola]